MRAFSPVMKPDRTVKDEALGVLAENDGLRLTDVHQALKRRAGKRSIQATRKALAGLVAQGVLEKKASRYAVSLDWAVRQKAFVDGILAAKTRQKYAGLTDGADYTTLTFDTLFELDNFWNYALLKLSRETAHKEWLAADHFLWFFILNAGYETSLIKELKKQNVACTVVAEAGFRMNDWALGIYRALGVKTASVRAQDLWGGTDVNVVGDAIVNVRYDPAVMRKIREVFAKYASVGEIPAKAVAELATLKGRHEIKIIRDAPLANKMRDDIARLANRR